MLSLDAVELSHINAKQDKVEIEIGDWFLSGDDDDIGLFVNLLCFASIPRLGLEGIDRVQVLPWLNRPQGTSRNLLKLRFRQGQNYSPLIAGTAELRRSSPNTANGGSNFRLTFVLSLNPTRFARYFIADVRAGRQFEGRADLSLAKRDVRIRTLERILDRKDNVLTNVLVPEIRLPTTWTGIRDLYWRAVLQYLARCVADAANGPMAPSIRIRGVPRLNLRYVETYWDFGVSDASVAVKRAQSGLSSLSRDFSSRQFPDGRSEIAIDGHAISHTLQLTNAVKARVYAKTDLRVRIEIAHDLRKDATVIGGGHQIESHDFSRLDPWFDALADASGTRARHVLETFRRANQQQADGQVSAVRFLLDLLHTVETVGLAEELIGYLAVPGAVDITITRQLRPTVRKLVQAGVLEQALPRSGRYRVASRYAQALEAVRRLLQGR